MGVLYSINSPCVVENSNNFNEDTALMIDPAYTFGTREHKYSDELLALLKPFPIRTVYADNNYAYVDRLSPNMLVSGKKNTQRIERDHLTLRTRIKRLCRKTICFSKSKEIHIAVIGTFINTVFFGRNFDASTLL